MDRESVLPAANLSLGSCLSDLQIVDLSTPILPPARARSSPLGQQRGEYQDQALTAYETDMHALDGIGLSHIEPEHTLYSLLSVG